MPLTELELKLKSRKDQDDSEGTGSRILAWNADRPEIESWLCAQGFEGLEISQLPPLSLSFSFFLSFFLIFMCSYHPTHFFFPLFRCLDKLSVTLGKQLYKMNRDDLRETCGFGEGTRLFSHLQRDKPKVIALLITEQTDTCKKAEYAADIV